MPAESPSLSGAQTSLTADPERFSDTAWDLLIASQDQARRWRHGSMDVEHLLLALLLDRRFTTWSESLPIDEDRLLIGWRRFALTSPPHETRPSISVRPLKSCWKRRIAIGPAGVSAAWMCPIC